MRSVRTDAEGKAEDVKTHRGFTLIELLTVMAIIALISSSLGLMMKHISYVHVRARALRQVMDGSRNVLSQMARDIHNAYYAPANGGYVFAGNVDTLDLNAFAETSDGVFQVVEVGYYVADGLLMRRLEATGIPNQINAGGAAAPLAQGVRSFALRYGYRDGAGNIVFTSGAWRSSLEQHLNYTRQGAVQTPDGLPVAVHVTFSLQDEKGILPERTYEAKLFVPSAA